MHSDLQRRVSASLRDVPDFPKAGIVFKDITPLLADPPLMAEVIRAMAAPFLDAGVTHVVGVESRGFLFGMPLALHLGAAFAPARKPGKLPWKTVRESFALEYGEDALELHTDAVSKTSRVLIVDDVLATGGTAAAAVRLVRGLGADVVGATFLSELQFLQGRSQLDGTTVASVLAIA
ncbi:MAG: adenine phosphoribosyltransferase [Gemmatimonadaceae bacterium]|nr:adenine phosphoribosyltransferase [Gemmatimonadaceae bacterium]